MAGVKAKLSGGDEGLSWQHLAFDAVLHDASPSLDFAAFRVKHEKVWCLKKRFICSANQNRVIQVKGLAKGRFFVPITDYNLILRVFSVVFFFLFYIITLFFCV